MSLAGMGVVALWHDVGPEAKEEFHEWHSRERMPERVGIPGFRRGRRYVAVNGAPEFFVLYEADSPEVLGGIDFQNRLNAPSEWSRRVVPKFRNVARSICRVVVTSGTGSGGVLLTSRFEIDAAHRAGSLEALTRRILPALSQRSGIAGVHLCLADEALSTLDSAERQLLADAPRVPGWIVLIEGNSAADVRTAQEALAPGLQAHNVSALESATYRLEFTRLKTPWSAG
jgi:hypothetical protein